MKQKISTSLLILLGFGVQAQSNTIPGGGTATGSGGSSTFTIGQIDYSNSSGANGSDNQGVQQPFEFFKDSGLDGFSLVELSLYPNPTTDQIVLKSEQTSRKLNSQLFDNTGKLLLNGAIYETETLINMHALSAGEYHISIQEQNEQIESFKIIKH